MDLTNPLAKIIGKDDIFEGTLILTSMKDEGEREEILKRADKEIPEEIRRKVIKFINDACHDESYVNPLQAVKIDFTNIQKEDYRLIKTAVFGYLLDGLQEN